MQIYNRLLSFGSVLGLSLFLLIGATGWTPAAARDAINSGGYESAREAYRQGITAYDEGWYDLAFPALSYAAKRKVIGAQLTVAKMYAQGIWVRQSHKKAFDIYDQIRIDNLRIVTAFPRPKGASLVAEAYVELAKYYNSGLVDTGVEMDHQEAFDLFMVAARSLGSAEAQYELAKMYLSGRGVRQNSRKAIRWLINADKNYNYPPAQALLGKMFWNGNQVERRRPVFALALLSTARKNASKNNIRWISALYNKAYRNATKMERNKSERLVARWRKKRKSRKMRKKKLYERFQNRERGSLDIWQPRTLEERLDGKKIPGNYGIAASSKKSRILGLGQFQNIDTPISSGRRYEDD